MPTISIDDYLSNLKALFQETFKGTGGESSQYIDGKGHGSLLETLDHTDSRLASMPLKTGGATIAAHTEHLRYYIRTLQRLVADEKGVQPDWPGSWQTRAVTPGEWEVLKAAVRTEVAALIGDIDRIDTWDDDRIGGTLSILAHSAYHLGAIRLLSVTLEHLS
jgi:hypothetical protein